MEGGDFDRQRGKPLSERVSDPLQCTLFVRPNIADHQDPQKHCHFRHTEPAERPVAHRPWVKENGLHVEDYEQDGDDVEADRVAAPRIRRRLDAALVGFELGNGRSSLAAPMATTGNATATARKMRIGR